MTLLVTSEAVLVLLGLLWLIFACECLTCLARKKRAKFFSVYKFENNLALQIVFVHLIALIVY